MPSFEELIAQARAAWPQVQVDDATFRAYLAERLGEESWDSALASRRLADLYLCCACARGDSRAIASFRQSFLAAIIHSVSRAAAPAMIEEVTQVVMTKLFVADGGKPPGIASYLGNGKLSTWLQVVARRQARSGMRSEARRGANARSEDDIDELMAHAMAGEELGGLKERYREHFKEAFRAAFARLEPRERNMLRYECADGLTRDQIAQLYGVSRATVARWRAACREKLFEETRKAFGAGAEPFATGEFKSVMRLIESQLDVSLSRLLSDSQ
jgi:RNA polymerase sigma-70 factor (ECF subfamily)